MTDIIYLGAFPSKQLIIESNGKIDSLYRDGVSLVDGFRSLSNIHLTVITSPDISSFPKNKAYFKSYYDKYDDAYMVSSLNLVGLKQIWTACAMTFAACKTIKKSKEKVAVLVPYMVFRHVLAAKMIKILFNKKVDICIVIPDIFFPKNRILQLFNFITERLAKKFDDFVLYTDAMADYLKIKEKKYIVIEGFHKVEIKQIQPPTNKFIVSYAGSLNIRYGIERLLDAFNKIVHKDIELHLYGRGDADGLIKERAKTDARIKYFGLVPKDQATAAIYSSSLLINPRNATDGEYVQYSFPSKDIDYLASGVPCVLCKLPGMPKEYYGHFIDAGDGSAESLAAAIKDAYSMTPAQRESLAIKAQQFIRERMDTKKQAERIIQLINS